jgi:hypothetical protein
MPTGCRTPKDGAEPGQRSAMIRPEAAAPTFSTPSTRGQRDQAQAGQAMGWLGGSLVSFLARASRHRESERRIPDDSPSSDPSFALAVLDFGDRDMWPSARFPLFNVNGSSQLNPCWTGKGMRCGSFHRRRRPLHEPPRPRGPRRLRPTARTTETES